MIGPGLLAGCGPVWQIRADQRIGVLRGALMVAQRFKGVPSPVIATGQLTASTIVMIRWCSSPTVRGLFSASPPSGSGVRAGAAVHRLRLHPLFQLVASAGPTNASL
jgi:hypothetical protein